MKTIPRILLITSVSVVVIGVVLSFAVSFYFYRTSFDQAIQEKTNTLKILSDSVAGPLLTFREPLHPLVIENIFQKVIEVPDIMFIRSFNDKNKTIIISGDQKEAGAQIENPPAFKRDIAARDGIFEGEKIKEFFVKARDGTNLWMGFSLKSVKKNILINTVILGIITALLIMTTALATFFIFRRILIDPLELLTTAFNKLKNKDYQARLDNAPVAEVQEVFQSFNKMAQDLGDSYQSLIRAEMDAKKNESMFRAILDAAPVCIKWFDKGENLISINRVGKIEHFLEDKTEEEIKNWNYLDCIEDKYRPGIRKKINAAINGVEGTMDFEHISGMSRNKWCQGIFAPIRNSEGIIDSFLFLSRDITKEKLLENEQKKNVEKTEETKIALFNILEDVKQSEAKLKEERDRSQAIISSMGEGLIVVNKNYEIILINKKAKELLEVVAIDVTEKDIRKIVSIFVGEKQLPDEEQPMAKMFKTPGVISIGIEDNYYYVLPSGKKFPVEIITAPLHGDGITGAVIVFQDISKEKGLDEAKNSFISIASHQLRTPLTSIRWYAEMLGSEDAGPLNENQKSFVSRVYGSALKLNEVINLLLSMARIESGKTAREIVKIDPIAFTNEILKELEPQFKQKNINVNLIPLKETVEINYDASMLRQIITNILSNTIRYTNQDGQVEVKLEKKEKELIYSVKDDGIGIPADQQDKIFNKFFRADNASAVVPDGSGLGLSLIRALVEMNGGKVWFESPTSWINKDGKEEKKGTAFYFTLAL